MDAFYCPSQDNLTHTRKFYPDPWGTLDPTYDKVKIGYHYRPYLAPDGTRDFDKIDDIEPRKLIAMDMANASFTSPHRNVGLPAWNLLKVDGSVALRGSAEVQRQLESYPAGLNWPQFEAIRDQLNEDP